MDTSIKLRVDGKMHDVHADPAMPLLYALRDNIGLENPRFGCGLSQCGACTVHVDGKATRSCVTPASVVEGRAVTTLGGLGTPDRPHPLQTAFAEEQAMQCGYCLNGWIMAAADLLAHEKAPSRARISEVTGDATKSLAYTDVLAGLTPDPKFPLTGASSTTSLTVPAKPKAWSAYTIAGAPLPRKDAADKAFGRYPYVVNVKQHGMLHGRFLYPPRIGATRLSVDASSIAGIGDARIVRVKDLVGVVATREWDAVRAARQLKTTWSAASVKLPAQANLAADMWAQTPFKKHAVTAGSVDAAMGTVPVTAEYLWPFQAHANMGPGCTVVGVRADGVTVWSGTQKTHALRTGIAKLLAISPATVRVLWVSDAGSYGRGVFLARRRQARSRAVDARGQHAVGK